MYIYYNPNPSGKRVGDCVIRGISKLTGQTWQETYIGVAVQGYESYDMPSSNAVWAEHLKKRGYRRYVSRDGGSSSYYNDEGMYHDGGGGSSRDGGSSHRRYYDGGGSNSSRNSGYSGHSMRDRAVAKLEEMYDEARTEHERQTVSEWINRLESDR